MIVNNPQTNINQIDKHGVNAFWVASFYGHIEIMRYLLSKGIDTMSRNLNGSNALHIAVKKGNLKVVRTLLDMKYPLNYTKSNGVSAVGIAAFKGNIKLLDLLYREGADINLTSKMGAGPLYLAIKMDKIECVKYLIDRNAFVHLYDQAQAEYSPLYQSIKLGNLPALELICDTGINLDSLRDNHGFSPLNFAVKYATAEIANYISLRVKNIDDEDPEGLTAF
jgi:ankyrin repeat protein